MTELQIKVEGLDKLIKAFDQFPREVARTMSIAGHEAATKVILAEEGLGKHYPPESARAQRKEIPYYQRGAGTVYASGTAYTSENLGKKWHVRRLGSGGTEIGNVASYAERVHGDKQTELMKKIGWRKLKDVAKEKVSAVQKIYQTQINALIRRLGL